MSVKVVPDGKIDDDKMLILPYGKMTITNKKKIKIKIEIKI